MNKFHVIFTGIGEAELQEIELPALQPDEVLLENDYTVISAGTERANLLQLPNTVTHEHGFPHGAGYSGAGRVVAVGGEVTTLKIGDRVVIPWGGHRSHTVKKASDLVRIDDDTIDLLDAAFAHIASFSFLGVRKLRLELGESAAVAGMGILGAFTVQLASLSGAVPVVAIDMDPVRRKLALELGAARAFSPDEPDVIEKIKQATAGGPNAVVEVTGSAAALQQALEYVAWEGRISLLGCTRISDAPIDFYKYVHRRGVSLIGAHTFTRAKHESSPHHWTEQDDYRAFLRLLAARKLHTRPLISEIVSPAQSRDVYARLAECPQPPLGIVFDWSKIR